MSHTAVVATLGHVEAAAAPRHPLLDHADGPGQSQGVLGRQLQEVEGDALSRLRPDAGQPAELVDEILDRGGVHLGARKTAEEATETSQATETGAQIEATERLALELIRLLDGVAHGGQDQILEQFDVGGVDDRRIDHDLLELQTAGHLHPDRAAAGASLDHLSGRRLLGVHKILLHLSDLGEQRAEIQAAGRASQLLLISRRRRLQLELHPRE